MVGNSVLTASGNEFALPSASSPSAGLLSGNEFPLPSTSSLSAGLLSGNSLSSSGSWLFFIGWLLISAMDGILPSLLARFLRQWRRVSQRARIINKQSAETPRPRPTPRPYLDSGLVADGRVVDAVSAGIDDALVTVINTLTLEIWLELVVMGVLLLATAGCDVAGTSCTAEVGKGCDVIAPREFVFREYTS